MDEKPKPSAATGRPFLSVHLKCCNIYQRIYPNAAGDAYAGWCPRCATAIRVPIVESGGTSTRFFTT